jgi:hypothetical protein
MQEVVRLRAVYQEQRDSTNLVPPAGRAVSGCSVDVVHGIVRYAYWYDCDDDTPRAQKQHQVILLADIPGTCSGDIVRLKRNLPTLNSKLSYEIIGDEIRQIGQAPLLPSEEDDDSDDNESINKALANLPVVQVDSNKHFVKRSRYVSEIQNLLLCQGGTCPGIPKSAHIVHLLGKSTNEELVFQKLNPRYILASVYPLSVYKAWILQLIDGLRCLHSLAIVHRDLRIENLLFTSDNSRLLICDLESHWGNRQAPEISRQPILNAGWTEKSDIYDLGCVIKGMIYGNAPITNQVEWHVPPPLNIIVAACTHDSPTERPNLDLLYAMVCKFEEK